MRALRRLRTRTATTVVVAATIATIGSVASTAAARDGASADPPRHNELRVTATDAGYRMAGHLTTGPATIRFTNSSHAPHALDLYRLAPGVTVAKVLRDVRNDDWAAFATDLADGGPGNGNPNIVSPGHTAVVVGDGLQAGTYAMMDGTPGSGGVPSFLQGYAATVTVTAASVPPPSPASDGEVLITDTAIHLPPAIRTGRGTFAVHYQGAHEFQLLRLRPGATVRQAFDYWFARFNGERPAGPPPAQFVGGLADLRPGVHGWVRLHLSPGTYGIWSIENGDFTDIDNGLTATFTVHGQIDPD
jgi:hypothetical protein